MKIVQRFKSVDPLASDYAAWSPYNYVLGNPISLIDPDGRSPKQTDPVDPPKFQKIEKPSDLFSMKMLNNLKEGVEYAVSKGVDEVVDLFTIERKGGFTATTDSNLEGGGETATYTKDAQDYNADGLINTSKSTTAGKMLKAGKIATPTVKDLVAGAAKMKGSIDATRKSISTGDKLMKEDSQIQYDTTWTYKCSNSECNRRKLVITNKKDHDIVDSVMQVTPK